jgi:hypothetical protein
MVIGNEQRRCRRGKEWVSTSNDAVEVAGGCCREEN